MSNEIYFISQTENMRFTLLLLEWIFCFICFELALIFFIRFLKQKREKRDKDLINLQELGYASLFMGYSVMWFFFIIADYYSPVIQLQPFLIWSQGSVRYLWLNFGYLSLMIGAFCFIVLMEKYKQYLIRRYFFSMIFLLVIIFFIVSFLIDLELTQGLSIIFWPPFILFLIIYLVDFTKKMQIREKRVSGLLKILPGFICLTIGFIFTTDFVIELLGLSGRFIGSTLQLISMILIFFFFMTLPPFSEFDWKEKMEDIFIMEKGGICLYHKGFGARSALIDDNLVAGAISSINMMLNEITKSEGITVLNKKNKTIILYPSKSCVGIIFSKEELNYIKVLLKDLCERFDAIFGNLLVNWDGNVDLFKSSENIINEIFSLQR